LVSKGSVLPAKETKKIAVAHEYLQRAISESRSLAHRLMPKAIEDYGYQKAVEGLIENIEGTIETKFEFFDNLDGFRLPRNIELCLFRITQEAITNVIKFAHASNATIQVLKNKYSVILTIDDDGIGFDKSKLQTLGGSFGVNSMKNRATAVGGQFYIDTLEGKGTQLMVEIPNLKQ